MVFKNTKINKKTHYEPSYVAPDTKRYRKSISLGCHAVWGALKYIPDRISMLKLSRRGAAPPRSHTPEAALCKIKKCVKKTKDEKKATKAKVTNSLKTQTNGTIQKGSKAPSRVMA
uniref:Uncharacterized protein n=1 Tax=Zea mays TaxID=4577 RepID=A0A804P1N3_MAIZE